MMVGQMGLGLPLQANFLTKKLFINLLHVQCRKMRKCRKVSDSKQWSIAALSSAWIPRVQLLALLPGQITAPLHASVSTPE